MQLFNTYINIIGKIIEEKTEIKDKYYTKKIVNHINKNDISIISGIKYIGKTSIICEIIRKTKIGDKILYIDKIYDYDNIIKDSNDLDTLLEIRKPRYIIMQNTKNIKDIKSFLSKIIKEKKYKIIIIGNDIKINNIKEIEVKNNISEDINNQIKYGNIGYLYNSNNTKIDKNTILLITKNIISEKIFILKNIQNHFLYILIITKLSKNDSFLSIRYFHKDINSIEKISLKTYMDYIDFSLQEKIIKKIYLFDNKKNKIINSNVNFYFSDNGFRNSLYGFNLEENILIKNLIFIKLDFYNYDIYSIKNGVFIADFLIIKENKRYIYHLSESKNNKEIKKEVSKLLKIGSTQKIYLIHKDIKNLNIKKYNYDNLEIVSLEKILKKSL